MTDLRLIDLLPLLADMPLPLLQAVGGLLDVEGDVLFATKAESVAGREDEAAKLVAGECLALARSKSRSVLLTRQLRVLVPLAEHVSIGTVDERTRLLRLTLREMRAFDGIDEVLAAIVSDVLTFGSATSVELQALSVTDRIYTAAAASAIATHAKSPFCGLEVPVGMVAAWGRWEVGLERLSQLHDAVESMTRPPELDKAVERISNTPLAVLGAAHQDEFDPTSSLRQLIATLDSRQHRILEQRPLSIGRGSTLEELAREMDVTRERIRQLESGALERLEDELNRPRSAVIRRSARRLAETVGAAAPVGHLRGTQAEAAVSAPEDELSRLAGLLLLYVAGPYEVWGDWLVRRPAKAIVSASAAALEELFETDFPLVDEALAAIQHTGVNQDSARDWLGLLPRVRVLGEYVVPWSGTLADKAEIVLRAAGRPLSPDEIGEAIGEEFSIRTLRNYLLADPRFRRLGLRVYGLDSWGGDEYTTISDEIAQEIERRGGETTLEELVETLTTQFGVTANSVKAYATGPQFERSTNGLIRVRSSRAQIPTQPVEFTRRCFRTLGRWSYRITVTHDTLRGSGCSVPLGFAGYLQLAHGHEVELEASELSLRFTWPSLLPCVGSLRPAVDALGAKEGDYLFVVADPLEKVASILRVSKDALDAAAAPQERLLLEVGTTEPVDDAVATIADALGLNTSDASWASIRRRLRARGEEDLLALLPKDESGDESGLDDLMALVGV